MVACTRIRIHIARYVYTMSVHPFLLRWVFSLFSLLATVNTATMNTGLQISV